MATNIGDLSSVLLEGLSSFWQRFWRDTEDLEAYYQSSEIYLGQTYLDLMGTILNIGIVDTPIFNKEQWKLFSIREDELLFIEGSAPEDNRFYYDMPGDSVSINYLQNTIFSPDVLLERDVDFEVENNDGYIRFKDDIFRVHTTVEGDVLPLQGVAWRYITLNTGNRMTDVRRTESWYSNTDVQRGDTLRLDGYAGVDLDTATFPLASDGTYTVAGSTITFVSATYTGFTSNNLQDVIQIYDATNPEYNGLYVISAILSPASVRLHVTQHSPLVTAPGPLSWKLRRGVYFEEFRDSRIDYIDDTYLVGDVDSPFSLSVPSDVIYSVVRERPGLEAIGTPLNTLPTIATETTFPSAVTLSFAGTYVQVTTNTVSPFYLGIGTDDLGGPTALSDYKWFIIPEGNPNAGVYVIKEWVAANIAIIDYLVADADTTSTSSTSWTIAQTAPQTVFPGVRHISNFVAHAHRYYSGRVVEGVDYEVDYLNGRFTPLRPIEPLLIHTCTYTWLHEVVFGTGGSLEEYTEGKVKQVAFWVPQVTVDRFNLFYVYGDLLNRFSVSSEVYKSFLRGIMQLYILGPSLERIEAALNVTAGLRLVRNDGEILQSYGNGVTQSGADGEFLSPTALHPYPRFQSLSATFAEIDVGRSIVIEQATEELNIGRFKILNVIDTNTVEVEAEYGVVNEATLEWVETRDYLKTITTDQRVYQYPYNIPIRDDIMDSSNWGTLTFRSFEPLTTAFTVTDYIEDAQWYYDKVIPEMLWPSASRPRRIAATELYENIIGPSDDARIGDPGLFIGADDDGNVTLVPDAASLRHCAAFILFDRYLKFHMFYVKFSDKLDYTDEFIQDLDELVLVAKPSYTYPYVEPVRPYEDIAALTEVFDYYWAFSFGYGADTLDTPDHFLGIGLSDRYMKIGDYFRYVKFIAVPVGFVTSGGVDAPFVLPMAASERILKFILNATVNGGDPLVENTDYTVDYDPDSATAFTVTPLTAWDAGITVDFTGLGLDVVNVGTTPIPDTTIGLTPICIGGEDPGYVRKVIGASPSPSEMVDRAISLFVNDGGSPYIYP